MATVQKARIQFNRPKNWKIILAAALELGPLTAAREHRMDFPAEMGFPVILQAIKRWIRQFRDPNRKGYNSTTTPVYGLEIDKLVYEDVLRRQRAGLTIMSGDVRKILVAHLYDAGKSHLLLENGGNYVFGDSWASRFFNRHNLVSRAKK
jgi:hypothetical protein